MSWHVHQVECAFGWIGIHLASTKPTIKTIVIMKNIKHLFAFFAVLLILPSSFACGDYGAFRLQRMTPVEMLAFDRVFTGEIVAVHYHPQDSVHQFFEVKVIEQFHGVDEVQTVMLDGNKSLRLYHLKEGQTAIFLTNIVDGKEVIAYDSPSMQFWTKESFDEHLSSLPEKDQKQTAKYLKYDLEQDEKLAKRFRSFQKYLVDGAHEYVTTYKQRMQYTVENGKLQGTFTVLNASKELIELGKYEAGKMIGTWTYFYSDGSKHEVIYEEELATTQS